MIGEAVTMRHVHVCRWYVRCCQYCKACLRIVTVQCKQQLLRAWLSYCLCMAVTQNWLAGCTVTLMTLSPTISLRSAVNCMLAAAGHPQTCVTHWRITFHGSGLLQHATPRSMLCSSYKCRTADTAAGCLILACCLAGSVVGSALADHPRGPVWRACHGVPAAEGADGADLCAQARPRQCACPAAGSGTCLFCGSQSCRHM